MVLELIWTLNIFSFMMFSFANMLSGKKIQPATHPLNISEIMRKDSIRHKQIKTQDEFAHSNVLRASKKVYSASE